VKDDLMSSVDEHGRIAQRVDLEPTQLRYLETMMGRYAIPDVSKAVRVLVNFAMAVPDQEESIFKKTRCRHCL
jgi:hypothetical protein